MTTVAYTIAFTVASVLVVLVLVWLFARRRQRPVPPAPSPSQPERRTERPVDPAVANILASASARPGDTRTNEEMIDDALRIVTAIGGVSVPALQRKLKIDFARATELVGVLEERGYVSEPGPNRKRKILPLAFEHIAALDGSE